MVVAAAAGCRRSSCGDRRGPACSGAATSSSPREGWTMTYRQVFADGFVGVGLSRRRKVCALSVRWSMGLMLRCWWRCCYCCCSYLSLLLLLPVLLLLLPKSGKISCSLFCSDLPPRWGPARLFFFNSTWCFTPRPRPQIYHGQHLDQGIVARVPCPKLGSFSLAPGTAPYRREATVVPAVLLFCQEVETVES